MNLRFVGEGRGGQVGLKGAIFFWNLPKNDRPEEQLVEIAGFPSGILKSWTANKSYADIGLKGGGEGVNNLMDGKKQYNLWHIMLWIVITKILLLFLIIL